MVCSSFESVGDGERALLPRFTKQGLNIPFPVNSPFLVEG